MFDVHTHSDTDLQNFHKILDWNVAFVPTIPSCPLMTKRHVEWLTTCGHSTCRPLFTSVHTYLCFKILKTWYKDITVPQLFILCNHSCTCKDPIHLVWGCHPSLQYKANIFLKYRTCVLLMRFKYPTHLKVSSHAHHHQIWQLFISKLHVAFHELPDVAKLRNTIFFNWCSARQYSTQSFTFLNQQRDTKWG